MKRFKVLENEIWEETGKINVHNFPPGVGTFSYVTKAYKVFKDNPISCEEKEGDPVYFHDMTHEMKTLASIIGISHNSLHELMPKEKFFKGEVK